VVIEIAHEGRVGHHDCGVTRSPIIPLVGQVGADLDRAGVAHRRDSGGTAEAHLYPPGERAVTPPAGNGNEIAASWVYEIKKEVGVGLLWDEVPNHLQRDHRLDGRTGLAQRLRMSRASHLGAPEVWRLLSRE